MAAPVASHPTRLGPANDRIWRSGSKAGLRGLSMSTQNINRVDHILYIAWPENQEAYVEQLSKLCKVKFYGPVDKPEFGIRLYINWAAGLEVVSPVSDTAPWSLQMRDYLERRGEGVMNVIFGVRDINEAKDHE